MRKAVTSVGGPEHCNREPFDDLSGPLGCRPADFGKAPNHALAWVREHFSNFHLLSPSSIQRVTPSEVACSPYKEKNKWKLGKLRSVRLAESEAKANATATEPPPVGSCPLFTQPPTHGNAVMGKITAWFFDFAMRFFLRLFSLFFPRFLASLCLVNSA